MVLSSIVAARVDISHAAKITYDRGLMPGLVEEGVGMGRLGMLNAGYVWMGLNVLCSAGYVLGMRRVIKNMRFRDWDSKSLLILNFALGEFVTADERSKQCTTTTYLHYQF